MRESRLMREQRQEGLIEARRADVVRIVGLRFAPLVSTISERVRDETRPDELARLLDLAATAKDADAFRVGLGG